MLTFVFKCISILCIFNIFIAFNLFVFATSLVTVRYLCIIPTFKTAFCFDYENSLKINHECLLINPLTLYYKYSLFLFASMLLYIVNNSYNNMTSLV